MRWHARRRSTAECGEEQIKSPTCRQPQRQPRRAMAAVSVLHRAPSADGSEALRFSSRKHAIFISKACIPEMCKKRAEQNSPLSNIGEGHNVEKPNQCLKPVLPSTVGSEPLPISSRNHAIFISKATTYLKCKQAYWSDLQRPLRRERGMCA